MSSMTLGEALVYIRADDRALWNSVNKIQYGLSALGRGGLGALGSLGGGIASGLMVAVGAASNLKETFNKLDVVFGNSAGVASAAADEMASRFGIVKQTFLDVQGTFGNLLQGMGKQSESASATMSASLAKAAADASSLWNTSFEDASFKIASALRGMSRPITAFGIDTQLAAVKQEALRMGLVTTNRDLTMQEKVAARASLILRGLSVATGDLEYTQQTFANATRAIGGRITNVMTTIGQAILPVAEGWANGFNSMLRDLQAWVTDNRGMFRGWAEAVDGAFKWVGWAAGEVWGAIESLGKNIIQEIGTWTQFNEAVGQGWQWLRKTATDVFEGIGVIFRNWSLIGAYAGVKALEMATNAGEAFKWMQEAAAKFGTWFAENWLMAIRDVAVGFHHIMSDMGTNVMQTFKAVGEYIAGGGWNPQFRTIGVDFVAKSGKLPDFGAPQFTKFNDDLNLITQKMVNNEVKRIADNAGAVAGAAGNILGKAIGDAVNGRPRPNKPLPGDGEELGKEKKARHEDLSSFAKSLQEAAAGKSDAQERTATATQQMAKDMGALVGAVVGKKLNAMLAVAGGPE